MRSTRKHAAMVFLLMSLVLAIASECQAQNSPPTEYQIKAAFIYNFARFVEWPDRAFPGTNSPMTIGLLGENVFGNGLAQAVNGKVVKGHPLLFKEFTSLADATNCQVLFISASEKNHLSKIIGQLRGASILTVSETDNFLGDGGMINLLIVDDKVRFEINNEAAKKAGLIISSKLLSLAINNQ